MTPLILIKDREKKKKKDIKAMNFWLKGLFFFYHSCRGRANQRELRARRRWKYSAIASKHLAACLVVRI